MYVNIFNLIIFANHYFLWQKQPKSYENPKSAKKPKKEAKPKKEKAAKKATTPKKAATQPKKAKQPKKVPKETKRVTNIKSAKSAAQVRPRGTKKGSNNKYEFPAFEPSELSTGAAGRLDALLEKLDKKSEENWNKFWYSSLQLQKCFMC